MRGPSQTLNGYVRIRRLEALSGGAVAGVLDERVHHLDLSRGTKVLYTQAEALVGVYDYVQADRLIAVLP